MRLKSFFIILLVFIFVNQSFSQLVNVEKRRKRANDTIVGAIGFSANLLKNTKQVVKVNTNLALEWNIKQHTFLLYGELAYHEVGGSKIISNGYEHLRYNYSFIKQDFLTLEFFVQAQFNQIKLLNLRQIVGGGPRFRIYDKENFYLYISPLVMFERELENNYDDRTTEHKKIKGDLYLTTGVVVNEVFSINHVIYYQPNIYNFTNSEPSDFRLFSETAFNFKAFKRLVFSFNFAFSYDSMPPIDYKLETAEQIPNLFYSIKNGISFTF